MLLTPAGTTFQNSVSASQSILILFKKQPNQNQDWLLN
jgi:hypothetical protein